MKLSVTKAVDKIADKYFEKLLLEGAFPEVHFSISGGFKSYHLFEYCDAWGKFAKVLDRKMKETIDPLLGLYTRKHSASVLAEVDKLASQITEDDVIFQGKGIRTFADAIRESL